jgi:hypothetical protein
VKQALRRALLAAIVALAFRGLAQLVYVTYFCQPHSNLEAVQRGTTDVVQDRGERVARIGDAIFTCETNHRIGPYILHRDLDCFCAAATLTAEQVGDAVSGSCRLDHPFPTRLDQTGSCRYARCNHYVTR